MKRLVCVAFLAGCGAARPAAEPPSGSAAPPPPAPGQPAYGGQYPAQAPQGAYPQPAPAAPVTPPSAGSDLDRAQRELEVAAGDCTNACRALSSMDRAAGRICSLASASSDDGQRCADAKIRVYSARDKVKNTCGTCPDTSVERSAPVPSSR